MSHKDLLISEDFKLYRKAQAKAIVVQVKNLLFSNTDPKELRGAVEMARKIIRLPEDLTEDKNLQGELNRMIQEDLNQIAVELTRETIGGIE